MKTFLEKNLIYTKNHRKIFSVFKYFSLYTLTALLILISQIFYPHHAQAQEKPQSIEVKGQVHSGTSGSPDIVSNLEIFLISNSTKSDYDQKTITDKHGQFSFTTNLPAHGDNLGISLQYKGAIYGNVIEIIDEVALANNITIYEPSGDQNIVSVATSSILFAQVNKTNQTISALEIANVINNSDRTYVPGPQPMSLVRFSMPPSSIDLTVDTNLITTDILQVDKGFALTASVPPGQHQVMFSYVFPYDATTITINKSMPYGTDRLRVLLPLEIAQLSSESESTEEIVIGNRKYQLISTGPINRGSRINITLSGLPKTTLLEHLQNKVVLIDTKNYVFITLIVILLSLTIFAIVSKNIKDKKNTKENINRTNLIRQITDLEEMYISGEITENAYLKGKERLINQIASYKPDIPS